MTYLEPAILSLSSLSLYILRHDIPTTSSSSSSFSSSSHHLLTWYNGRSHSLTTVTLSTTTLCTTSYASISLLSLASKRQKGASNNLHNGRDGTSRSYTL